MLLLPRGLFATVVVVRSKIVSVIAEKTQPGPPIALKLKDFGWAENVGLEKCFAVFVVVVVYFYMCEPGLCHMTCVVFSYF